MYFDVNRIFEQDQRRPSLQPEAQLWRNQLSFEAGEDTEPAGGANHPESSE
jgi:hypothetical protein